MECAILISLLIGGTSALLRCCVVCFSSPLHSHYQVVMLSHFSSPFTCFTLTPPPVCGASPHLLLFHRRYSFLQRTATAASAAMMRRRMWPTRRCCRVGLLSPQTNAACVIMSPLRICRRQRIRQQFQPRLTATGASGRATGHPPMVNYSSGGRWEGLRRRIPQRTVRLRSLSDAPRALRAVRVGLR